MQQLTHGNHVPARDACAAGVLDVGLLVSRFVRAGMWRHRPEGLTLAQLRALSCVDAYPDGSPSQLAEFLLLSRPAATRLANGLVRRKLLSRRTAAADRRRVVLTLTATGRKHLDDYFATARHLVAERLRSLTPAQRRAVTRAMTLVSDRFETR